MEERMIYKLLAKLDESKKISTLKAHCDVPCGVYDPIVAQIAGMTVARMTDMILELEEHYDKDHQGKKDHIYQNKIARMVGEKERSAAVIKEEIRIIWGDFFKPNHLKEFPQIHGLTHSIMALSSECKQNINFEASRTLVEKLNEFSMIFWEAKNIKFKTVDYHCKPNLKVVFPEL
jgi:nickel superoxide dismutase